MGRYRGLKDLTAEDVTACAKWWAVERVGWPGARAVRTWLVFDGNVAFDPEAEAGEYYRFEDDVRAVWRTLTRPVG